MRDRILNTREVSQSTAEFFDGNAPAVWSEATRLILEKPARPERAEPRAPGARQSIFGNEAPAVWSEATGKEDLIG
jgi:hypothetical protein